MGIWWWGYLETIYGWTLLKGWDIQWKDLANPIHPYQWPPRGTEPPKIPATQILPSKGGGNVTTPATTGSHKGTVGLGTPTGTQ